MHNISDEMTSYHTVKTAMEMQGDSLKDVNSAIFVRETQRIFRECASAANCNGWVRGCGYYDALSY